MTIRESLKELRESLDALQKRLAEFGADETSVSPEHRERFDMLQAQANAVKAKLPAVEGSVWDAVRQEVKRDLDALAQNLEQTVSYIDAHYNGKR
ncbi:MAG: hypothetical protein WAU86_11080 [Oricola sp.]